MRPTPRGAPGPEIPPNVRAARRSRRWGLLAGVVLGVPAALAIGYALVAMLATALGVLGVRVTETQALSLLVWSLLSVLIVIVLLAAASKAVRK